MKFENSIFYHRVLTVLIISVTVFSVFGWLLSTYKYCDDYPYSHMALPTSGKDFWTLKGPQIESFSDAKHSVINHYRFINGRFSHFIVIPMQLFPRWVTASFCALSMLGMFFGILAVALRRTERLRPGYVAVAAALLWIAFPWYDSFQSVDFQINYSTASALTLMFICFFRNIELRGRRYFFICVVVAFFSAWIHEGFALPLLAYVITYAVVNKLRTYRLFTVLIAVVAGLLFCMLSPGIISRLEVSLDQTSRNIYFFNYTRYLSELWPLWLALALNAIVLFRLSGSRRRKFGVTVIPYYAAIAVSFAIAVATMGLDRYLWVVDLYSAVIILYTLGLWKFPDSITLNRVTDVLLTVGVGVYFIWSISLVYWQQKVSENQRAFDNYLEMHHDKTHGLVFFDLISVDDVPFWLMSIPNMCAVNYLSLNQYYCNEHHINSESLAILPDSLKGRTFEELPQIARNYAGIRGVWPVILSDIKPDSIRVTAWGDSPAMTPINRFILSCKGGVDTPVSYIPPFQCLDVTMPGDKVCYLIFMNRMPRTVINRRFVVLDTIKCL